MEDRNNRRKRKYNLLVEAGYSPVDSNKYKDLSNFKVTRLIEARKGIQDSLDREYLDLDHKINMILKGIDYD